MEDTTIQPPTLRKKFANHVFACGGTEIHVWLGHTLFKIRNEYQCPKCGESIKDISDTPLGMAFFAIVRPDLPRKP